MKRTLITSIIAALASASLWAGPSILDIKHSITDPNVVPPESFETKTLEMNQNFYLNKFALRSETQGPEEPGTPEEYEKRLATLPTEIEMPYNSIVGKFIDMYIGKRRGLVADMLALHNYYGNIFAEELLKEKMPLELQYLPVVESALNPNAVSRAGAVGLWQFMPATATGLGLEINSLVDQRRDPRLSSRQAARYLKQLYDIYGNWSLAIAAYNCGPGNVNKAMRRAGGGKKDFWEIYAYLPLETRGYVPAFIAANYVMNFHNSHGIAPTVVSRQLVTDTILINDRVHFDQISSVLNIPIDEIRMLNPQFRKDVIPGDNHPYALVLPSQQCLSYIMSENDILRYDSLQHVRRTHVEPGTPYSLEPGDSTYVAPKIITHKVRRGENLRSIAQKYGVSATEIKRLNNLRRGKVRTGQVLTIEVYENGKPSKQKETPAQTTLSKTEDARQQSTAQHNTEPTASQPATPKAKPAPAVPQATKYKVKKGDTLDKIARAYGTTAAAIRKANGMRPNDSNIQIGETIKIPAKSAKTKSKKTKRRRRR